MTEFCGRVFLNYGTFQKKKIEGSGMEGAVIRLINSYCGC